MSKTPPHEAHAPIEMHHFGSGICCQIRWSTGIIFSVTRPPTIMRSAWRGEKRITSAPKRDMSKRDESVDIISIEQHAVPNTYGQRLCLRAVRIAPVFSSIHSRTERSFVVMKPSSVVTASLPLEGPTLPHVHVR